MSVSTRVHCPLDCPDVCVFDVHTVDGKIKKISGAHDHAYTQGFVCSKAQKMVERLNAPDRITSPLRRRNDSFEKITWQEALAEIADRLNTAKAKYGPTSVLFYSDVGSAGVLRTLEERFFNAFGGATYTEGSLCWGAVSGAQKLDFGEYRAHSWEDTLNSKTIVLWSRNIAVTSLHMVPFIRKARENGAYVICIDPNRTQTAVMSDLHIPIRPGTDGVFAMGVANIILQNGWADLDYIAEHTANFEGYLQQVKNYTLEITSEITGVEVHIIKDFASKIARNKPASVWLGYGFQRYNDSGQTVRAIDALGAITGNIGKTGGGINHATKHLPKIIADISGKEMAQEVRYFKAGRVAEAILSADPPIEVMMTVAANPVVQLPNTNKVMEAFAKVPFKVVSDFFLTDTARLADIVLPCTSVFEKEDVMTSSWTPYLGYNPKVVEPPSEAKPDYEILMDLADIMGISAYESKDPTYWLEKALSKTEEVTLSSIKENKTLKNPYWQEIPWKDGEFVTGSGKFEFLTEFIKPIISGGYRLLTPHPTKGMHSQFYNLNDTLSYPVAFIPMELAEKLYIKDMDKINVETQFGSLIAFAKPSQTIHPETIAITEGSWISENGGVNLLTGDYLSDIGDGTSYNEVFCKVRKIV